MNEIIYLLNEYGYIILFSSLMLELIILPIPNEALISYVDVLCFEGKMNIFLSITINLVLLTEKFGVSSGYFKDKACTYIYAENYIKNQLKREYIAKLVIHFCSKNL